MKRRYLNYIDYGVAALWMGIALFSENWSMAIVTLFFFLECLKRQKLERDVDEMLANLEVAGKVLKKAESAVHEIVQENKVLTHNLQVREQQLMERSDGVHRRNTDAEARTGATAS